MVGKDVVRQIMSLPQYHFLHYDIERENASVHVLKLGRAVTKEDEVAKQEEEKGIREGRVEEAKAKEAEDGKELQSIPRSQARDTEAERGS